MAGDVFPGLAGRSLEPVLGGENGTADKCAGDAIDECRMQKKPNQQVEHVAHRRYSCAGGKGNSLGKLFYSKNYKRTECDTSPQI